MHGLNSSKRHSVKFAKQQAKISRELIPILEEAFKENPKTREIFVSRVVLSREGGSLTIFVACPNGLKIDKDSFDILKAYKPSIRMILSRIISGRWTPQVIIRIDTKLAKIHQTNTLIEKVMAERSAPSHKPIMQTIEEIKSKLEPES